MSKQSSLNNNFGYIKDSFNNLLAENIVTKSSGDNDLFKKYLKIIKENEILKTQFIVYTNIENKVESDSLKATLFVKENIELFSKFKKQEILEANQTLAKLLPVNVTSGGNDLYENINNLIFAEKSFKNIDKIVEATTNVVNHILNNKSKEIIENYNLPNSVIGSLMVEKYNQKYSDLSADEKELLKSLINSDDENKKQIYSNLLRECVDLINENLKTDDLEIKDKLLRVKDKLLNDKQEINEDFLKNISKLTDLKNNLKGEL